MLNDYFIYNGIDSRDLALRFQNQISFSEATPSYSEESVPGRNGTLSIWDGNYENVTATVKVFQLEQDITAARKAASALLLAPGYHRLEVSDNPDCYRIAKITSGIKSQFKAGHLNSFEIKFDCKPQIYLKDGETAITFETSGETINNPYFESLPLITVYGSGDGAINVGGYTVTITDIDTYITLDCEAQDAYKGITNLNSNISAPEFPKLANGENIVSFSGGVTSVEIVPRWWFV